MNSNDYPLLGCSCSPRCEFLRSVWSAQFGVIAQRSCVLRHLQHEQVCLFLHSLLLRVCCSPEFASVSAHLPTLSHCFQFLPTNSFALLDEATSALDVLHEERCLRACIRAGVSHANGFRRCRLYRWFHTHSHFTCRPFSCVPATIICIHPLPFPPFLMVSTRLQSVPFGHLEFLRPSPKNSKKRKTPSLLPSSQHQSRPGGTNMGVLLVFLPPKTNCF